MKLKKGEISSILQRMTRVCVCVYRRLAGCSPLILAATAGHASTVEILLDHGADIEAQSDRTKDTALSLACSGGRQEVLLGVIICCVVGPTRSMGQCVCSLCSNNLEKSLTLNICLEKSLSLFPV